MFVVKTRTIRTFENEREEKNKNTRLSLCLFIYVKSHVSVFTYSLL